MNRKLVALAAVILVVGCSSSSGSGSSTNKANPCATPGATYLVHFVEQSGGTCGPVSDEIENVGSDGTIAQSFTCQQMTQTGCTVKNNNCTTTNNGVTCQVTTDVTFASDGTSASGLETLSCTTGGQSCTSTYAMTAMRQ